MDVLQLPALANPYGGTTTPAVPEKTYPHLYFTTLSLNVEPDRPITEQYINLRWRQYNHDTGEFEPNGAFNDLRIEGFWNWVNAARASADAPSLREQWIALGVQLGALEINLEKFQSDLDCAQGGLDKLTAQRETFQHSLDDATSDEKRDEASLADAQASLAALPADASEEDRTIAQGVVDAAQTAVNDDQARAATATKGIVDISPQIEAAQSARDVATASVAVIKSQIGIA
jgi:hypothetical protein